MECISLLCRRQASVSVRNPFSEITPANRNRLGRKFIHGDSVTYSTLPCKLLAPSAKLSQNSAQNAFCELFCTKTTHHFTHTSPFLGTISVKFEHKIHALLCFGYIFRPIVSLMGTAFILGRFIDLTESLHAQSFG